MSHDLNCYLGPFLECRRPLRKVRHEKFGCPNRDCPTYGRHPGGAFCCLCGTKYGTEPWFDETEEIVSLAGDFTQAIREVLTAVEPGDDRYDFFVTNVRREGQPREFHYSDRSQELVRLYRNSRDDEVAWFQRAFEKEIEKARETYGPADVRTTWGYLQWWS